MRGIAFIVLAAAIAAGGCTRDRGSGIARAAADSGGTSIPSSMSGDPAGRDPCSLVSRSEAERFLGPLAGDPYRASIEGAPLESGTACYYRAASGRGVALEPTWEDGRLGMKAVRLGGGLAGKVLGDLLGTADTLGADWDDAAWIYGTLYALRGDALVAVDVTAAGGSPVLAATLADIALGRLAHPLAYDGAAAARRAPGSLVTPRDPCSLVTPEEAAAILGPLPAPPYSSGKGCVFATSAPRVRTPLGALAMGQRETVLEVIWTGGYKALYQAKQNASLVKGIADSASMVKATCGVNPATGEAACTDSVFRLDTMMNRADREMRGSERGRRDLAELQGTIQALGAATAESSLQLRHDTTGIAGPWDDAAVLAGLTFMAVKKDVLISVNLQAGLDKAKALVVRAMSRL